jgi:glyoxylase-like metal-dependent hydrolase (beta-lactamase superfamily II)/8-oxo-dGTP pyrophosphatase MutT (NUDIX family)
MKERAQTASLVLLRRRDDPEVFWVRRADHDAFLSGFHAFPGGALDAADHAVHVHGAVGLEAAVRVCAVRETFEETGFLFGARGPVPEEWREAVRSGAMPIGEALAQAGVRLAADALASAGCWAAPEYLGRAFDTWFFAGWAGDDASPRVRPEDRELSAGEWIRPADAVARWLHGEVLLAPPTLAILRALAGGARPETPDHFLRLPEAHGTPARSSAVRRHVTLFPVRTPTLPPATHTNCYVLGTDDLAVIDPAASDPAERAALDAFLEQRREEGRYVRAILLTHHHHDHVGGAEHLAARTGAPVWAHRETAARVKFRVDRTLADGEAIRLGSLHLRAIHTPGHAPGHLCYLDEATRSLAAGDMVAGVGTILVEPGEGSMAQYLDSLRRLRDLEPSCLMPSHGPVMGGVRHKLTAYIDHRLMREARVLDALDAGPARVDDLVPRVYDDVGPAVWPLARLSLEAHLVKLADEGRITSAGGGAWRRVET